MKLSQDTINQLELQESAKLSKLYSHLKQRKNKKNANHKARQNGHSNARHYQTLSEKVSEYGFYNLLLSGDPNAFDTATVFIESNYNAQSYKYLKQYLLQILKNSPKNEKQKILLRSMIWNRAKGQRNHSFRYYCRLAIKISTPAFHAKIAEAAARDVSENNWKMQLLNEYLNTHCRNY